MFHRNDVANCDIRNFRFASGVLIQGVVALSQNNPMGFAGLADIANTSTEEKSSKEETPSSVNIIESNARYLWGAHYIQCEVCSTYYGTRVYKSCPHCITDN